MQKILTVLHVLKGDFRRLPRVIIFTVASVSIYNFGWGFADPFLPIYFSQFASDYTVIGFFQTAMTAAAVIILIPLGDLLDRTNHQRLMIGAKIGYVIVCLAYFFAGQWQSLPLLLFALIINGFLWPFVWTSTAATIRDYSTQKDASLAFGFYLGARQIAWVAGLAIALIVVDAFPIHYIFLFTVTFVLCSIPFNRNQPDKHHQPVFQALREIIFTDKLVHRIWEDVKSFNLEMWLMYTLFFLTGVIPLISLTFIPLYAASIGFSVVKIGLLVLVMNIPFLLSFLAAELADHSERLRNILVGLGISAVALGLLSLWREADWHIFFFAFLLMAGYAIALPSISSIVTVLTPKKYVGTGSALVDIVLALSTVVFAPIVGQLIDRFSWTHALLYCALFIGVVVLCTALVQIYFKRINMLYHINHPKSKRDPYIL